MRLHLSHGPPMFSGLGCLPLEEQAFQVGVTSGGRYGLREIPPKHPRMSSKASSTSSVSSFFLSSTFNLFTIPLALTQRFSVVTLYFLSPQVHKVVSSSTMFPLDGSHHRTTGPWDSLEVCEAGLESIPSLCYHG